MAIYKIKGNEELEEVKSSSLFREGIKEVADLQRLLRNEPNVLEEKLFIIDEEFSNWQDSSRRIDLLALDDTGRLVVIELKRGDSGAHMELQAIRYAAMVGVFTPEDILEGDAAEGVRQHLDSNNIEEIHTENPRIMLVAEGFSTELTTSVLWLNQRGLEITCIQLQVYRNGEEILLEASQVIPVPGTEGLIVKRKDRSKKVESSQRQPASIKNLQAGGDAFLKTISEASDDFREGLNRLYAFATQLEKEELTTLVTRTFKTHARLELRDPETGGSLLVSFNNLLRSGAGGKERGGEISIWPDSESVAPEAFGKLDQVIGPVISPSRVRHRRLSRLLDIEQSLSVIKELCLEAKNQSAVSGADGD
ncbi:MAG: hypothetical protein F4X65_15730 [Chloroflexi bacterium]|nr:hypothetical protein [Chloroflexota bacterium]